ncbi:protein yippee-like 5 isoform X2 [Mauremys reevesii]|uniref:protein yippee-like 5 isoform X2 n=1 Tax=Mauremys reevesii TaxID=260615 RepID=UPI00193F92FD|nr:protein yippee-like 5 isoform X2 [Mauremys reevesii]
MWLLWYAPLLLTGMTVSAGGPWEDFRVVGNGAETVSRLLEQYLVNKCKELSMICCPVLCIAELLLCSQLTEAVDPDKAPLHRS